MPKTKEMFLKNDGDISKEPRSQLKWTTTGHIGHNFGIKINTDGN